MKNTLKPIQVVIGANYGDEGKGKAVYDLVKEFKCEGFLPSQILGIKYNGGAQAGHTARGFVHHTLSSGDTPTFLAKEFLFNPIALNDECLNYTIKRLMHPNIVYVDPRCRVTTPVDILMNRIIETVRNKGRHGSCGMGIHATIVRNQNLPLRASDLTSKSFDRKMFTMLLKIHFNGFCQAVRDIPEMYQNIDIDLLMDDFFKEADKCFSGNAMIASLPEIFDKGFKRFIFEGAQGLLLDMDNKESYPHVTPSHTGSDYVIDCILENWDNPKELDIEVNYVMRTFVTRHGAGPLKNEVSYTDIPGLKLHLDKTNVPNEWQGTIRYGLYDKDIATPQIHEDLKKWEKRSIKRPYARPIVTWIDVCKAIMTNKGPVNVPNFLYDFDRLMNTK